ncbi:hypothetical protein HJC99_04005 [Candidatus Saccharibacteria bacterium]|nr:hypothetical protein [Candidatus Saccharibacteria bacterium]
MAKSDSDAGTPADETAKPTSELAETNDAPNSDAPAGPTLSEALVTSGAHEPWPKRLWHSLTGTKKRLAWSIFGLIVIIAAIVGLTPLKYTIFGTFIKSTIDVRVSDASTHQLLPGADVKVAGVTVTTDKVGVAHFTGLQPGATTIEVAKPAYETTNEAYTLGFADAGTKDISLKSTGIKLTFVFTNYVTGQPVAAARVQIGDADAVADSKGTVTASLPPSNDGQTITANVTTDGFNTLSVPVAVKVGAPTIAAKLVPSGQVYFLSNRSGKVDLYGANLDGSNATVLLAGTGNEDQSTGILPNVYDQSVVALVSSRAGKRLDSQPQEDLYLFHPATSQLALIDSNIRFSNFRTWLGKSLVYQKYSDNNSASIQSYDTTTGKNTTIVTCTGDGACPQALYATDSLFVYSLAGAPMGSTSNGVFAVKTGTTSSKSISSVPAASSYRQTKDALILNYYDYNNAYPNGTWQSLNFATVKVSTLNPGPSNTATRTYIDSPGDKLSASIDARDGQSDLYVANLDGTNERQLTTTGDVTQFVQWFNDDYIVYSAANQLFVVGVAGGKPQKITNFYSGIVNTYSGGYNPGY